MIPDFWRVVCTLLALVFSFVSLDLFDRSWRAWFPGNLPPWTEPVLVLGFVLINILTGWSIGARIDRARNDRHESE